MRLYNNPLSSNARRVRLAAHVLGVPLELVEVNLKDDADRMRLRECRRIGVLMQLAASRRAARFEHGPKLSSLVAGSQRCQRLANG